MVLVRCLSSIFGIKLGIIIAFLEETRQKQIYSDVKTIVTYKARKPLKTETCWNCWHIDDVVYVNSSMQSSPGLQNTAFQSQLLI